MSYFVDVFVLHFIVSLHHKDTTSGHGLSSISGYFFHYFSFEKTDFQNIKTSAQIGEAVSFFMPNPLRMMTDDR